ncbi:class II glutamine amidotransferase, partial [Salmonella enterica subsp. enterica serovar Kentucky]|nr:class II glutamine amidotransferase [Salmonella enterica subsp. enterica serovar Kentucky]
MCELLGMSANVPTDICFSFTGLVQRGGGCIAVIEGCRFNDGNILLAQGIRQTLNRVANPGVLMQKLTFNN